MLNFEILSLNYKRSDIRSWVQSRTTFFSMNFILCFAQSFLINYIMFFIDLLIVKNFIFRYLKLYMVIFYVLR